MSYAVPTRLVTAPDQLRNYAEFVLSLSTNHVPKKLLISNRANDGKFHTLTTSSPHCMHTIEEPGEYHPWWLVDMGEQYHIETVIVTNRGDSAFGNFAILTY